MSVRSRAGSAWLVVCLAWLAACGGDDKESAAHSASADAGASETSQHPPDEPEPTKSETKVGAAAKSCEDTSCDAPAKCELRDDKPVCTCPSGYEDVKGDGSECKDRDECADKPCGKHARCENTPGSFECSCDRPAYQGDGKQCSCADGYVEQDGACVAQDGGKCSDNLDCAHGHCVSGICCASACDKPDAECKTMDGATCEDGKTCRYATAKDGTACDDGDACMDGSECKAGKCQPGMRAVSCDDQNACTSDSCDKQLGCKNVATPGNCDDSDRCTMNDQCKAGSCVGTAVSCTGEGDACNDGVCDPSDGACHKRPARDGAACDDGDSCSTGDRCAAGSCKGPDNACGPNASACTAGATNTCACKPEFHAAGGLCVPQNDECASNLCSPDATCFDPSNNAGDVTCKCKPDFEGDGKTCVAKDPCKGNPCGEGRGTCTLGAAGKYTCSCAAGFKSVGGTCGCDLTGTFAGRSTFDQSWEDVVGFEDGHVNTYNWLIQRNQVAADGSIDTEMILCGESSVDLCGNALGNEAYVQWLARNYYDAGATSAKFSYRVDQDKAVPGASYETPAYALLAGISLSDPLGAFPTDRKKVQGGPEFSGSATNGARWVDMDNDSFLGLTAYAVGPEGMSAQGDGPRPLTSYASTSPDCPRSNPSAKRYPYAYPPAADGLIVRRVKRFYSGSRVINVMRGKLDSCDAFSGDVRGPDNSEVAKSDGIVGGCVRVNGDGEAACSASMLDFVGGAGANATQQTHSSKYTFKRVADNVTCADVRAMSF